MDTDGKRKRPVAQHVRPRLDEVQFAAAVQAALKHYLEPDRLRANPLLRSRLVQTAVTGDPEPVRRVQALRRILGEQARRFDTAPKTAVLARVLEATYLTPAASQSAAAAQLGLPERSYRRYRKRAVALLSAWLWEAERTLAPAGGRPDEPFSQGQRPITKPGRAAGP